MDADDLNFIHGIARTEKALREAQEDTFVRVTAAHGEFAGVVTDVHAAEPGDGNHIVVVDANVFNGAAMDADTHTVTIDYEGAFTSEYEYYVPYIVGTADDRTLGDVGDLFRAPTTESEVNA